MKLRSIILVALLVATISQSFTKHSNTFTDYRISVVNNGAANLTINYISFRDAFTPTIGSGPIYPGNVISVYDTVWSGSVYVNITVNTYPTGPQPASRWIYFFENYATGIGHCQEITGDGTYEFHNVTNGRGAFLDIGVTSCE